MLPFISRKIVAEIKSKIIVHIKGFHSPPPPNTPVWTKDFHDFLQYICKLCEMYVGYPLRQRESPFRFCRESFIISVQTPIHKMAGKCNCCPLEAYHKISFYEKTRELLSLRAKNDSGKVLQSYQRMNLS